MTTSDDRNVDPPLLASARRLCSIAFGPTFSEGDWSHSCGGQRLLAFDGGVVVGHCAVVERRITIGGQVLSVGYVEAVAVLPSMQGQGIGTGLMESAAIAIRARFGMGVLSTGAHAFFERLGWEPWRGPTYVATGSEVVRTPTEDAGVMVLRTACAPGIDPTGAITCEAREGDDW